MAVTSSSMQPADDNDAARQAADEQRGSSDVPDGATELADAAPLGAPADEQRDAAAEQAALDAEHGVQTFEAEGAAVWVQGGNYPDGPQTAAPDVSGMTASYEGDGAAVWTGSTPPDEPGDPRTGDKPPIPSSCVVDANFHVGNATPGSKVCSYHAAWYYPNGTRRDQVQAQAPAVGESPKAGEMAVGAPQDTTLTAGPTPEQRAVYAEAETSGAPEGDQVSGQYPHYTGGNYADAQQQQADQQSVTQPADQPSADEPDNTPARSTAKKAAKGDKAK
jgi:hypothetical protein